MIHVKNNIYVSRNEKEWYKKVLRYDKNNIEALMELAKEYEYNKNYNEALDIYKRLASKGNFLAKQKILDIQKIQDELELRRIRKSRADFFDKLIKWTVVVLILMFFIFLLSTLNTVFFQPGTRLADVLGLNKNDIYNIFREKNVFLKEQNIFFYYGTPEEWEEPPENVFVDNMYADKDISIENLILNSKTKINEINKSIPNSKDKILLNVREYKTQKILYQVIWDKNNKDNYKIFKAEVEGEKTPSSLLGFNQADRAVLVDTSNNKAYLLSGNKMKQQFPVSTGANKSPTPKGVFKVEKKAILEPFEKYASDEGSGNHSSNGKSQPINKSLYNSNKPQSQLETDKQPKKTPDKKNGSEKKEAEPKKNSDENNNSKNNEVSSSKKAPDKKNNPDDSDKASSGNNSNKSKKNPNANKKSNNPYGPVWIGLNKPHYGLHGTNDEPTIGSYESAGCVRFYNKDIIDIYNNIEVGDYVLIK